MDRPWPKTSSATGPARTPFSTKPRPVPRNIRRNPVDAWGLVRNGKMLDVFYKQARPDLWRQSPGLSAAALELYPARPTSLNLNGLYCSFINGDSLR